MDVFKLAAESRQAIGNQVGALRRQGKIPAVVYGKGVASRNVALNAREMEKLKTLAGASSLVDLSIDGKDTVKVLIHDVQYQPLKRIITHVDLLQVRMDEKIDAFVAFSFVGESPAVKAGTANLVRSMDGIDVRCLPSDLVSEIEIDLGTLKAVGDHVKVSDLKPINGVEFLAEADSAIISANELEKEEEVVVAPAEDVNAVARVGEAEKAAEEAAAAAAEKKA